jgi:hypothetical protein
MVSVSSDKNDEKWKFADFGFLYDATARLLGYFVRTWYGHYLDVITRNFKRWHERGFIRNMVEPTVEEAWSPVFDFTALDMEKIVYINGIYLYILASHKAANRRLMKRDEGKRVMYLRGYDFEGSVAAGGKVAMGFSSIDTTQFNWAVDKLLVPDFQVFKVESPKDVYWETAGAQGFFYGDYDGLVKFTQRSILSFFVNALRWKEDVAYLLDRMDHFVVYLSSMTESVLWEIDQLDTEDRRGRVTLVFDEKAIRNKVDQIDIQARMKERFGDRVIWSKEGPPPHESIAEIREQLSRRFLLVTPEELERDIETHRKRVAEGSSRLPPGERETWLDFHFYPAVDDENLKELRDFSAWVQAYITACTDEKGIDSVLLFMNNIQLRIFMTLLLGDHHETGSALAAYSAVMRSTLDYYAQPDANTGGLSSEELKVVTNSFEEHRDMAQYIGIRLLAYGRSHEFDDFTAIATADFNKAFDTTRAAVEKFYEIATARQTK